MEHLARAASSAPCRCGDTTARHCGICRAACRDHHFPAGRLATPGAAGHCAPVGAALAALHVAGRTMRRPRNALGPDGWRPLLERCPCARMKCRPDLAAELEARSRAPWRPGPRLPIGHIHADLFPDNVFFLDGRLSGLIDFYFAATDCPGVRRRGVSERLVLRAGFFVQCHEGSVDVARVRCHSPAVGCGAGGVAGTVRERRSVSC